MTPEEIIVEVDYYLENREVESIPFYRGLSKPQKNVVMAYARQRAKVADDGVVEFSKNVAYKALGTKVSALAALCTSAFGALGGAIIGFIADGPHGAQEGAQYAAMGGFAVESILHPGKMYFASRKVDINQSEYKQRVAECRATAIQKLSALEEKL